MTAPPHIVFDCEVITPMFLAGSEQNGQAELRASSVRGMLRYWYRALLGGRGYTGPALAEKEARVFGTAGFDTAGFGKIEAHAGAVDVVVRESAGVQVQKSSDHQGPGRLLQRGSGTGYLWYSAALGDNDRGFLPEGTGFQVALVAPRRDEQALEQAAAAFWMLAHLGGLGTRSRSGAGSFWVKQVKPSGTHLLRNLPPFTIEASNTIEFGRHLDQAVPQVVSVLEPSGNEATREFDVFAKGKSSVIVANMAAPSALGVAEAFGKKLQRFRGGTTGFKDDLEPLDIMYDETKALKQLLYDRPLPRNLALVRPGFGLPFTVTYKHEPHGFAGGTVEVGAPRLTRRASPLHVKIARLNEKKYDVILTFFASHFLPEGALGLTVMGRPKHGPSRTDVALLGKVPVVRGGATGYEVGRADAPGARMVSVIAAFRDTQLKDFYIVPVPA